MAFYNPGPPASGSTSLDVDQETAAQPAGPDVVDTTREEVKKTDPAFTEKFQKGDPKNDISEGPIKNRGCTDIICLVIFLVNIAAWIIVTLIGIQDGDLGKLYKPRDFAGNYCGVEENWNSGPNLKNQEFSTWTMNVSQSVEKIKNQLVCSTPSKEYLNTKDGFTTAQYDDYLCDCCLVPCTKCDGSLDVGEGGVIATTSDLSSTITAKMFDLTGFSESAIIGLFSPAGANGELFSTNIWESATSPDYMHPVCLTACTVDYTNLGPNTTYNFRTYTYKPPTNDPLYTYWIELMDSAEIGAIINDSFSFQALSQSDCNYDPIYCVPFPGVEFEEAAFNYCTIQMSADVIQAVGDTLTTIIQSEAILAISDELTQSFGEYWGNFQQSLPAFFITAFLSFVIGIVFLVLVRFFAGICVWLSILTVFLVFCAAAGLCWIKSIQCAGAGIFETGHQTGATLVTAVTTEVEQTINGDDISEDLVGDGNTYRGVAHYTKDLKTCQKWTSQSPHAHTYTPENYPNQGLGDHNYCRNPYLENSTNRGSTIWCWTTDPDFPWGECNPIGLTLPECENGYAVSGEAARKALEIICYILLGFAGLWVLIVLCFINQIRLAIKVTQVAARFLASTPTVLIVPIVQSLCAIIWVLAWASAAGFLLSQVPEGYTPTTYYATWDEAYTACIDDGSGRFGFPVSEAYKDELCGGPNGECFLCKPPRYIIDERFAYSFFTYLWNNAFLIALGQCIIAGAVGAWFFTPDRDKGSKAAVWISVWNAFRYHIGSLAFGAFIIAVVQFIRYVVMFLEKHAEARKNYVMQYILKAIQCCIYCLEKCIEYINKNAYIQIALLGVNFCTAAKRAFYLIFRHAARFASVLVLGNVLHAIGWISIMSGTIIVGYLIQVNLHEEVSPVAAIIVFTFMGYAVGVLYMNVFSLCVDASLQCFIAAEEMEIDPEFIPKALRSMVKKSNKLSS